MNKLGRLWSILQSGAGRPVVKNNFNNRQAQGHLENNLFTLCFEPASCED